MGRNKAVAYITSGNKLLVFHHTQFPEAGIQVPAGSIEPGERAEEAVIREAQEETGLEEFHLSQFLGEVDHDFTLQGQRISQKRFYYHLLYKGPIRCTWIHYEFNPSDGSEGPIEFEFFWVMLPDDVPELIGEQGVLLEQIPIDS